MTETKSIEAIALADMPLDLPQSPQVRDGAKLHNTVVRSIGGWVLGGTYTPGAVLPTEAEMATRFKVSRTAIREAIKVISAKGLIESRPRIGAVVRPHDEWRLLDPAVLSWHPDIRRDQQLVASLIEARRIIEPAAAELAAKRCSSADLAAMEAAYLDMERSIPVDIEACCEADLAFHRGLIAASHNIVLLNLVGTIEAALRASFLNSTRSILMTQQARTLHVHKDVLEHIRVRDAAGAREAMLHLLDQAAEDILDQSA
jgi:DNA-binding FadR family transcriptional regulator